MFETSLSFCASLYGCCFHQTLSCSTAIPRRLFSTANCLNQNCHKLQFLSKFAEILSKSHINSAVPQQPNSSDSVYKHEFDSESPVYSIQHSFSIEITPNKWKSFKITLLLCSQIIYQSKIIVKCFWWLISMKIFQDVTNIIFSPSGSYSNGPEHFIKLGLHVTCAVAWHCPFKQTLS